MTVNAEGDGRCRRPRRSCRLVVRNGVEVGTLNAGSFSYDGETYWVSPAYSNGKAPVWRFYNKKKNSHFYTADPTEKASVITHLSSTYTYEGTAFWLGQ